MPKVYLLEEERRAAALKRFIYGKAKAEHITQTSIAESLGINRSTLARKIENGSLTFNELGKIFKILNADNKTVCELLIYQEQRK